MLCRGLQQAVPHEGHRQALSVLVSKELAEEQQQGQCLVQVARGLQDRKGVTMNNMGAGSFAVSAQKNEVGVAGEEQCI